MTTSSAPAIPAQPSIRRSSGRVPELEDPLNHYVYHPLAFRLARLLQPTGTSPNAVSAASGGLVCMAAILYTCVAWPFGALAGFACHLTWHVADGADGDLARLTGKASPIGEFVDGAADYLGHVVLYVLLAAMLDDTFIGLWAWPLASLAGASRIVQSNHTETQRREFLWRVYGIPWLRTQQTAGGQAFAGRGWLSRTSARSCARIPRAGRIDGALFRAARQADRSCLRRCGQAGGHAPAHTPGIARVAAVPERARGQSRGRSCLAAA